MAGYISCMCLVLFAISTHYLSSSDPTSQREYPSGGLACKTYNMTRIDCSNRNLQHVPVLDQILTTLLDLSQNQLMNITNSPFEKLQVLLKLNLSYNEISQMSSTAFRGLESLKSLDLEENMLVDLPKDIFSDLHNLLYLNLNFNLFTAIPDQALTPLYSLQHVSFSSHGDIHEIDIEGLKNLTNLNTFHLFVHPITSNISSDTIYPLRNLPLRDFAFGWFWADEIHSISKDVFQPLTSNITQLITVFAALPALLSLQYPCQTLLLYSADSSPQVVDNTSLQVLQKWNTSLEILFLTLLNWERVEDYTFIWISSLIILDLSDNNINYLAGNAFYGLNSLLQLFLSDNSLTFISSDALEVFRKPASLQYLDLSSNVITKFIDRDVFSSVSTSLSYLNFEISSKLSIFYTSWIGLLHNLKHLLLTCKNPCIIYISSDRSVSSLQTIQITNIVIVSFEAPLCNLFPTLKISRWSSYSDEIDFPLLEAIQGCTILKELDLSGVLQNTNLVDFKHLNITLYKLETLKLARNEIASMKLFFFINAPKLKHLDLAGNSMKTIDSEIPDKYPGLIYLSVQENKLTSLSGLKHFNSLQNLKASSNKITEISTWLLSEAHALQTLDLNDNPFQCTCRIEPFRNWIISDKKTWLQPGQYVCATPDNFKGISITAIELNCRSKTTFYLSVIIPSILFFSILLIFLYRYRWYIKYKLFLLYRNYHQFPNNDEDFELLQLQYHAYVAYNENSAEDDAWVMNELQPNMEEGPEPLRLCIKSRDFTPGHFLLDSIDESIHQSRKTILVLSPNFVASEWCYHEMQMAQMRLLDDNLDVVVLVLLEAIPENKMTLSLRQLLCKKEYLKWPKNKVGQRLFWQQLRQEITRPVHVDRCFQR